MTSGADTRAIPWRRAVVRVFLSVLALLGSLGETAYIVAADAAPITAPQLAARTPPGFDHLLRTQQTLVDVSYGGQHVGEAMATFAPGWLRFSNPDEVAKLIPRLAQKPAVVGALSAALPTHPDLVCINGQPENCGHIAPAVAAIIFNEDRFEAEVFVNSAYLQTGTPSTVEYLPTPTAGLSLSDSIGGAIAGAAGERASYSLQNRIIVGYRNARVSTELLTSPDTGLRADTFAAGMDAGATRYQAGLFWSPGLEFFGQSRIYGIEASTQADARMDHEQIIGSPITVFLMHRSQVDILREGRLLVSKFYDAGNQILDTSVLPDGSYNIIIRIREPGLPARELQQLFVKSRTLPSLDQPLYSFDAGFLSGNPAGLLPSIDQFYMAVGAAERFSPDMAIGGTATMIGRSLFAELSTTYFTDLVTLHAATIASTRGDLGALVDAAIYAGPFSLRVDGRKTWGSQPLSPFGSDNQVNSFNPVSLTAANQVAGNTLRVSGGLFFLFGAAQLGLNGTYASQSHVPASYSFGPSFNWPFYNGDDLMLTLVGNGSRSDAGTQAYLGVRVQFNGAEHSVIAESGFQTGERNGQWGPTGATGSLTGSFSQADVLSSDFTGSAGMTRTIDHDSVGLNGQLRGDYGSYSSEVDRDLDGPSPSTRYNASFVTGGVVTGNGVAVGGADVNQSGIVVRLDGSLPGVTAEVFVNGAPSGEIKAGHSLPIFLPPYQMYSVRLAPQGAPAIDFDTSDRKVTLFPGNIETLIWKAEPVVDIFGRAVDRDGRAVADARIEGAKGPGMTDASGYFQLEIATSATLVLHSTSIGDCEIKLANLEIRNGYAALGNQICMKSREPKRAPMTAQAASRLAS